QSRQLGSSWNFRAPPKTARRPAPSRVKIRIIRSASCFAMSGKVIGLPLAPGVDMLNDGPRALPSLGSDAINSRLVGNQMGPRQLELPPLILHTASAGS